MRSRITDIYIDNFKSLMDFDIKLSKFACLIGLNSAGKSTVLQAIDFLCSVAKGSVQDWLLAREWDNGELLSKLNNRKTIAFRFGFNINGQQYVWRGSFNATKSFLNCSHEQISRIKDGQEEKIFWVTDNVCRFIGLPKDESEAHTTWKLTIEQKYNGSFLSSYKGRNFNDELKRIQAFFKSIKSLELLSPPMLRKASRDKSEDIGIGGERLASFLSTLDENKREQISNYMKKFDESFDVFSIRTVKGGWKKLSIFEKFKKDEQNSHEHNNTIEVSARHMSDGLLRLMSILAQSLNGNYVLLFDEIENGINPEFMELLVEILGAIDSQVIVTTHSPIFLNFIDEDVAKDSVCFIYKNKDGITKQIPFFSIPQNSERLEILGPGEAMLDVSLMELSNTMQSNGAN